MGSFDVEVLPSALSEWAELPTRAARLEVAEALETLATDPRPPRSFRLIEQSKRRLYLDTVVVIYLVHPEARKVWVLEVMPRPRGAR